MHKRARTLIIRLFACGMILALCASIAFAQLREGEEAQGEAEGARDADAVGREIEQLTEYLGARNWRVRLYATEKLGEIGTPEIVVPLTGVLDDENYYVVLAVITSLGRSGAREAVEPLIRFLDDDFFVMRIYTAEALGNIGSTDAVEALIESLGDENEGVKLAAAEALKAIGEIDTAQPFVKLLEDSYYKVRRTAAAILDDIGYEPATERENMFYLIAKGRWSDLIEIGAPAAEPLAGLYLVEDYPISSYIGFVLRRIGEPAADSLLEILKEPGEHRHGLGKIISILVEFGDERAIEPLIEIIKDPGPYFGGVNNAIHALGEFGEEAIEPLIALLGEEDIDYSVIVAAAIALGKTGDPRAIEALARHVDIDQYSGHYEVVTALLNSEDERAIEPIIESMRYNSLPEQGFRTPSPLAVFGEPAVIKLIEALNDEDPRLRREVAQQLGGFEDERVVEPLIGLLNDEDEWVRWRAALSLGNIRDPRAVEPLIMALNDNSSSVRRWAVSALGTIGDPRAVEPLIGLLDDENRNMRDSAAISLGRIGGERATDALVDVIRNRDEHLEVRRSAARYLGELKDGLVVDAMMEILNPNGESTCRFTIEALGKTGDERAVEPLISIMRDEEESTFIRSRAARVLAEIGGERAIGALIESIEKGAGEEISDAIRALGHTGDERFVEIILPYLKRLDSATRATAAAAIERLGYVPETVDERVTFLIAQGGRASGDNWGELAVIGGPAVEPLIEMLKDENNDIRSAAAETLGKIGDERAVEPLKALQNDSDSTVRVQGFEALMMIMPAEGFSYL